MVHGLYIVHLKVGFTAWSLYTNASILLLQKPGAKESVCRLVLTLSAHLGKHYWTSPSSRLQARGKHTATLYSHVAPYIIQWLQVCHTEGWHFTAFKGVWQCWQTFLAHVQQRTYNEKRPRFSFRPMKNERLWVKSPAHDTQLSRQSAIYSYSNDIQQIGNSLKSFDWHFFFFRCIG